MSLTNLAELPDTTKIRIISQNPVLSHVSHSTLDVKELKETLSDSQPKFGEIMAQQVTSGFRSQKDLDFSNFYLTGNPENGYSISYKVGNNTFISIAGVTIVDN